ncbi:ABC transporter ATP-binding protein [Galbibacter sp. EGI 63066]|uniref:ABC transporter ATP-binding protein n=1 Tax=Galbibacter sp. EGI 63066 TaxID=2993559 RepID=UPI002248EC8B|nr:ABC transporter ATP-binding protein [Galbibacter sp. EGI 63066]MCX2678682.1 ABC transporter ATP-binding protein [Galbibacter sp. EGI 63066]
MIIIKDLTKKYGEFTALNQLNLHVRPGEIYCLLGANGAGKTTTINILLGFVSPSSGQVSINGYPVTGNASQTKKYLAYIPETVTLYPNLTGIENLKFFSSLAGYTINKDELSQLLIKAGLQEVAHQKSLRSYSKGMRQKVGIAIALAKNAKVLLLDEPISGLDPKAANEFSETLKSLSAGGTTILMATHDIFRAREVAHRIGIMNEGNLVSELEAQKISANKLEQLYLKTV